MTGSRLSVERRSVIGGRVLGSRSQALVELVAEVLGPRDGAVVCEAELSRIRERLAPGERATLDALHPGCLRISLAVRMKLRGGRTWLVASADAALRPPKVNPALVRGLKAAHAMMDRLQLHRAGTAEFLSAKGPGNVHERGLARVALLAPDIQKAILDRRQPRDLTMQKLMAEDLPFAWRDQRCFLGFD